MNLERTVSVIGLGYVGLPVAVAFGKTKQVIGFDINKKRLQELRKGVDLTLEVESKDLKEADILFTDSIEDLKKADFHIVAVPTPIDNFKKPDLMLMIKASESVGKALKKGDIVVYESTVYPGVCEDDCLPVLEKFSGLKAGVDFKIGYSPERINPGDKEHTFTTIKKVVSAQDTESLEIVAHMYSSVVKAGVHKASSIKVAEAAKVIENTQRDVNIALMNELALLFNEMNIDTKEVLEAAGTKWNFLKFFPGLVGGHCIGVDPYYLTYKAESLGFHPQVILSGRKINDSMGKFIAQKCIKEMIKAGSLVKGSTVTVLGLTFKENCPDLRNSRVIDIINELKEFGVNVQIFDPLADKEEAVHEYGVTLSSLTELKKCQAVVAAVAHREFKDLDLTQLIDYKTHKPVFIDVKSFFEAGKIMALDCHYWRL